MRTLLKVLVFGAILAVMAAGWVDQEVGLIVLAGATMIFLPGRVGITGDGDATGDGGGDGGGD
jgi:hypothetical protein